MGDFSVFHAWRRNTSMPAEPARFIGIDLGTTNSAIAEIIWDPDKPFPVTACCLEIKQDTLEGAIYDITVPSMVALFKNKVYIGEGAKRLRHRSNELGLRFKRDIFYNCKNEIGTKRVYKGAPRGFQNAVEIGGLVLKFLYQAALKENPMPSTRTVITVPASFQLSQRQDTVEAAAKAGLSLQGGDLLDEPVAAFLDYIITHGTEQILVYGQKTNFVVFDFGGGTCDVAVFELHLADRSAPLTIAPLAVSRYYRLGGSDIDLAVLYEVLLPQLMEQNDLGKFVLDYNDKKAYLEPVLLGVAETLKITLCKEISRLKEFGKYEHYDKDAVIVRDPLTYECKLKNRTLYLRNPEISATQFEKLLEPFLDRDCLYARETEYRLTLSIFAPLQDALDRSGIAPDDIDCCLMVGGSSMIPQVSEAVANYFSNGKILRYRDEDQLLTSTARGAAYHAFSRTVLGNSLVQPVVSESIDIRTSSGLLNLVPAGSAIPYPEGGAYGIINDLSVPKTSITETVPIRVEILAGKEERKLLDKTWEIKPPVNYGEPLLLEYRYNENQVLELNMYLIRDGKKVEQFNVVEENPLTNVVNPEGKQLLIDEMESELTSGKIERLRQPEKLLEIAELQADLGQYEKALDRLKKALQIRGKPDANILNKMAVYYGEMGDHENEEKMYRNAAIDAKWPGAWFNLALTQKRRGKYAEALASVDNAIAKEPAAPYIVLRAMILEKLGEKEQFKKELEDALALFDPVGSLSDWELGWLSTAARMAGEAEKQKEAEQEIKRRARRAVSAPPTDEERLYPLLKRTSIRRMS